LADFGTIFLKEFTNNCETSNSLSGEGLGRLFSDQLLKAKGNRQQAKERV